MRVFLLFSFLLVTTSTSVLAQADKDELLHRLRNMTYLYGPDSMTLRDGEFLEDYGEDGIDYLWLEQVAFGDLDGDGTRDAAVVLVWTGGGTGVFYNVAAVLDVSSWSQHVATTPLSDRLGDRVAVDSVWIDSGLIHVAMVRHWESDAYCCPTLHLTNQYRLDESQSLIELDRDPYEEQVIRQLRDLRYAHATSAPFTDLPVNVELRIVYTADGHFYWGHHACSVWIYQSIPSNGWPQWERVSYTGPPPTTTLEDCTPE